MEKHVTLPHQVQPLAQPREVQPLGTNLAGAASLASWTCQQLLPAGAARDWPQGFYAHMAALYFAPLAEQLGAAQQALLLTNAKLWNARARLEVWTAIRDLGRGEVATSGPSVAAFLRRQTALLDAAQKRLKAIDAQVRL